LLDELEPRHASRWTKQTQLDKASRDLKAKQDEITTTQAQINSADAEAAADDAAATNAAEENEREALPGQIANLDTAIAKEDTAAAALQAKLDAPAPHALTAAQRTKTEADLKQVQDNRQKNVTDRDAKEARLDELNRRAGLRDDTKKKRRDFIRERTQMFAADFMRECDFGPRGHAACAVDFDYVLIEVPADKIAEIAKTKFTDDSRNQNWNGDPVLGAP
jgi:hypothetical protein